MRSASRLSHSSLPAKLHLVGSISRRRGRKHFKRGGIFDYHLHDTRHQFCTFAAVMGASNLELATATGHLTLGMLQRYTHMDAEVTKKYSNYISERILSKAKQDGV